VRDAISFWASLTETLGIDERDAILNHPDFLPSAEDLTDPAAFITRLKSDEL
jgi:uncharacterized protein (DUF2342 family)